ncbi:DUF2442 domain-containing protein [Microcoleus sp. OTE_8_concoct_300]|uniref:DUF2442 domain-containing protein n=1 Tax=Microcoleus sp. OTE_8_concoct_300 TaxID=2964710 RepID=UPI00403F3272
MILETEPLVIKVTVTDEKVIVDLADGRTLSVPLAWYPRLWHGSPEERHNIKSVSLGIVNSSSLLTVHCQPSTVNRQHHSGVTGNDIIGSYLETVMPLNGLI